MTKHMRAHFEHVGLYILFVGVPILLLLGVLRAGEGMQSPQSVGGRWKMVADGQLASALGCAQTNEEDPVVLRVGQSGRKVRIELRDGTTIAMQGEIDGNELTAEGKQKPEKQTVRMRAQVGQEQPQSLQGTVEVEGCPAKNGGPVPGNVAFRAVREHTTGGVL
jgi:hypothetical protein